MYVIRDFKGFDEVRVDLSVPMTVLIGANGVGKSNLIEAVDVLGFVARGQPVHAITDIGGGGELQVRGGLQGCLRGSNMTLTLGFESELQFDGTAQRAQYVVELRAKPRQEIARESLTVGERTIFSAVSAGEGLLEVTWDNFDRGRNKPVENVSSTNAVLSTYGQFAHRGKKFVECAQLIAELQVRLARGFIFDPHPRVMRGYERIGNTVLQRDGANISPVLYELFQSTNPAFEEIAALICEVPQEPFETIEFEATRLNDVIFILKSKDGRLTDAGRLSDGTLRALAVLTAVETVPSLSRLIVEEFDAGIHPGRVAKLYSEVARIAKKRNLSVLLTTHNPAVLDTVPPEHILVAWWDATVNCSRMTRFPDLPQVDELLQRGRLGDLVTRRLVEAYLQPDSDEERRAKVASWLEALPG
jgi:predicted ATPase